MSYVTHMGMTYATHMGMCHVTHMGMSLIEQLRMSDMTHVKQMGMSYVIAVYCSVQQCKSHLSKSVRRSKATGRVAVCFRMLQCTAACCSANRTSKSRCAAPRLLMNCSVLQCVVRSVAVYRTVSQCTAVCSSANRTSKSHCAAPRLPVCCSVFQSVAVYCSVLQCFVQIAPVNVGVPIRDYRRVAVCCSVLQCTAVCCSANCTSKSRCAAPRL